MPLWHTRFGQYGRCGHQTDTWLLIEVRVLDAWLLRSNVLSAKVAISRFILSPIGDSQIWPNCVSIISTWQQSKIPRLRPIPSSIRLTLFRVDTISCTRKLKRDKRNHRQMQICRKAGTRWSISRHYVTAPFLAWGHSFHLCKLCEPASAALQSWIDASSRYNLHDSNQVTV